ncbi:MAG: Asp-tRNA(Asn)/Glu-tRNA(Gln) amidotransferase subunit GatA [Patescibacteria group bacterium]
MNLESLTIKEARRALDAKKYSALELTDAYLEAIRVRDGDIHAYLEVWEKSAREEASIADKIIERGESCPLTGIPIAVKDNILIEGRIASAASKILEHYVASYDATVIKKLKEQGVVFLGRTNMDEFALGASTENSAFGPTKNPHDASRVPGGTSGGSAAAVACGIALAALGSDTGGSVRQPSAFCGVVGLKPTYGAVSRFGLIAAASSLDQIGTIGKTVDDAQALFLGIRGHDEKDSTSLPESPRSDLGNSEGRTFRIGVPRSLFAGTLEADTQERFEQSLEILRAKGYKVSDIELFADPQVPMAVYYIINPAEVSTNLARFDGIRYGLSVNAETIQEVYSKTRGAGFGPEVRRRILVGTFVLSSGYADAYYRRAREVRELIRADFTRAFDPSADGVDAIVTPTTPGPAFKFGEKSDPVSMYLEDIFTVPVNLAGVPAISVPSGMATRRGVSLPVGFQIIGAHGSEEMLFAIGKHIEEA